MASSLHLAQQLPSRDVGRAPQWQLRKNIPGSRLSSTTATRAEAEAKRRAPRPVARFSHENILHFTNNAYYQAYH
jgi:hypothetical protein